MMTSIARVANATIPVHRTSPMYCLNTSRTKSVGIFHGDNPLNFPTPLFLAQLASSSLITSALQAVLGPLGQPAFTCQMLGGFLLGPQAFGKYFAILQTIYVVNSSYVLNTVSLFSCALFLFLIGVKTNMNLVAVSGRKAVVIGACSFFVPLVITVGLAWVIMASVKLEPDIHRSLQFVATLQSASSFYVVACQLEDLKMLTSELGRLALSSSLISGTLSWSCVVLTFATTESNRLQAKGLVVGTVICTMGFLFIVVYIFRPIIGWLVERIQEARGVKEGHMYAIYMSVLGLSLFSDSMGLNFMFGPMIVGIIIPDGPPLGSALVEKLDTIVLILLLPMFYGIGTTIVNLSSISAINWGVIEVLCFTAFVGKIIGAFVPCILCKMPVHDALSLGLLLSTQGITDILMLMKSVEMNFVDRQSYSLVVISMLFLSGIAMPMVKRLYKAPDRYVSYKRRTIQHSKPEAELRMIACIYNYDNTPSIINLLEVSNPHMQSTVCVYLLHLMRKTGTASTLLYAHSRRPAGSSSKAPNYSDQIIKALRQYENLKGGVLLVNAFTAISPYVTMHEDVCNLALSKRAAFVIVPFHRQLSMANEAASGPAIRSVNCNILRTVPCSVGILLDRGTRCTSYQALHTETSIKYNVGVFFLGGQDDREALSYAMRMGEHPEVWVTVIHFQDGDWNTTRSSVEKKQDMSLINEFRFSCKLKQKNLYTEELLKNSEELISKIRAVENNFDIILVGRRHSSESTLLAGLEEWNEFPELGCIGDMLASSDTTCRASMLVMQQQTFIGDEEVLESPKYQSQRDSAVVDIPPRDPAKVWPGFDGTA